MRNVRDRRDATLDQHATWDKLKMNTFGPRSDKIARENHSQEVA